MDNTQATEHLDEIRAVVKAIVEEAAPAILKAIAASRPGVQMCGELMVTEPARDYEKELWIAAYTAYLPLTGGDQRKACYAAGVAVESFNQAFVK